MSCIDRVVLVLVVLILIQLTESDSHSTVLVVGSSGTLGSALIRDLLHLFPEELDLYNFYRDERKYKLQLPLLPLQKSSISDVFIHTLPSVRSEACDAIDSSIQQHKSTVQSFPLDLMKVLTPALQTRVSHDEHFLRYIDLCNMINRDSNKGSSSSSTCILINAAGVFRKGKSLEDLQVSLQVNCIAPALLAREFLSSSSVLSAESVSASSARTVKVINISSGDGEKCFINSVIMKQVENISSFHELLRFANHLVANYDEDFEYAFGDSPFYSLSKCLLNKATQLLHKEFAVVEPDDREMIKNSDQHQHVLKSIVAVCPGDFGSCMTTAEERQRDGFKQTPNHAAREIIDMALLSPMNYVSGLFYRHGKVIPW